MSYVPSGHFTANVDVYSQDEAFVEVGMSVKFYADHHGGWAEELADEMRRLEKRVAEYIAHAQSLYKEATNAQ